jgi:hypothetical protein
MEYMETQRHQMLKERKKKKGTERKGKNYCTRIKRTGKKYE